MKKLERIIVASLFDPIQKANIPDPKVWHRDDILKIFELPIHYLPHLKEGDSYRFLGRKYCLKPNEIVRDTRGYSKKGT